MSPATPRRSRTPPPSDRNRAALLATLVAFVAVVPFLPAFGAEILDWDDRTLLVDETRWKGFSTASVAFWFGDLSHGPWQPLVWASYAATEAVWGMSAKAHHAVNLILHGLTAGLLAHMLTPLVRRALHDRGEAVAVGAAAVAAMLWAVHPLRVEPVAWLTARRDLLSTLFVVASLLAWTRHVSVDDDRRWRRSTWYHAALLLFVLAMMCKATAMGWFLVLLALDWWPLRRGLRLAEKVPFLIVGVVVAAVALIGQQGAEAVAEVGFGGRIVLAGHGAWFPLGRTLIPRDLCALYQRAEPFDAHAWALLLPALLAVAVTITVVVLRRRRPGLAAAWAIALVLVAPVSGFVPLGVQAFADRFAHLPAIAIVAAVVVGVAAWLRQRSTLRVAAVVAVALAAFLGAQSFQLTRTWRNTETLFQRVLTFSPDSWLAHQKLAAVEGRRKDWREMIRHLNLATFLHEDAGARARMGYAYLQLNDLVSARGEALTALRVDLREPQAHETLGMIAAAEGDLDAAITALGRAVALDTGNATRHFNLGAALQSANRLDEARAAFEEALRLRPGYALAIDRLRRLR